LDVTNTEQQQQIQQQRHGHDVQRLAKQLARAQARLKQLTSENERLMEMSNSLRAERNRLVRAQQCSSSSSSSSVGQCPCSHGSTQPARPSQGCALPPGLWPLLALPAVVNPARLVAAAGGRVSCSAVEGALPSSSPGRSSSPQPAVHKFRHSSSCSHSSNKACKNRRGQWREAQAALLLRACNSPSR
jgi:hypothetical protein